MKAKVVSALIAGAFAVGATVAAADALPDQQKQAELTTMMGLGNPNAPARGDAIARSGAARVTPPRSDASAHEQALDLMISAGNPNAPTRGVAIGMSGTVRDPASLPDVAVRAQELDQMISSGNPNAPARGIAIARSDQAFHG